ncbi:MAG: ferritin-like domain-containing protein [Candidatus Sulfotelmatobacter sp.]
MPTSIPKAQLRLEDLGWHDGATVLLRRALNELSVGEWLELHAEGSDISDGLASWCRKEGCGFETTNVGEKLFRIQRGQGPLKLLHPGREVSEVADSAWGLAPRGAKIEPGGPEFQFSLRRKRDVWARDLNTIYRQAVANQWSAARDIPWSALPRLALEVESAVCQIMTFLTENEFAALYVPARFIPRIHPHFREVVEVLAVQVADEARHAEAFTRRAEAGGIGLGTSAVSGQLSLQTLLEEPDFTVAAFLLCVMGEGTFLTLLKFLEKYAPDPVTAKLAQYAHRDEARHVAFGTAHLRYLLQKEPERRGSLSLAVQRRGRMLASIAGLSPYVYDSLVVLSGGGISIPQIRRGAQLVRELHREMDRERRERLEHLGFGSEEAADLSAYHTKNFM